MNWRALGAASAILAGAAAAQEAPAPAPTPAPPAAEKTVAPAASTPPAAAKLATPKVTGVTPNAERIVAIGAINKRTGETRTFVGRPGQNFDFGGLHVVVRTCETTPPWEQKLTGAFLLIDERMVGKNGANAAAKRVFSGWMFAESPSLHPLEHPLYDIWVKSCTMRFPDTGPNTVSAGRADAPPSKAKKSAEVPSAAPN
jgi:hypothetical protein